MRIIAFSDWRVHSIPELINYIKTVDPRPDLILYAGDDTERFESLPESFFNKYITNGGFISKGIGDLYVRTQVSKDMFSNKRNYFFKLSKFAKYGLCYVLGNDCSQVYKLIKLKHPNVRDVNDKPLLLPDFAVIGQEGTIFANEKEEIGRGHILYKESSIRKHLNLLARQSKDLPLIVISHCPPYGILDYAIRYGHENIGSKALKEFITKKRPILVLCGHVHSQGGNVQRINGTTVINVASHDNKFARGIVAIIDINYGKISVKWRRIPSEFEYAYSKSKNIDDFAKRIHRLKLFNLDTEEREIIKAVDEYGQDFVNVFPELFWSIRMSYRYSIKNIIELYRLGIRNSEEITEEKVKLIMKKMPPGVFKNIVWQSYLRENAKRTGKVVLDGTLAENWKHKKIAYFDAEYVDDKDVVMYGFLVGKKIVQYNMTQTKEVKQLLSRLLSKDYRIFHYAGLDRKILLNLYKPEDRGPLENRIINVFPLIQKQLGLPVKSLNIHVVAKYLKDKVEIDAENDGWGKSISCNMVLVAHEAKKDFTKTKEYEYLLKTNKDDLIDLKHIVKAVNNLS
jgi:Icc-related predicted phosphoesterase